MMILRFATLTRMHHKVFATRAANIPFLLQWNALSIQLKNQSTGADTVVVSQSKVGAEYSGNPSLIPKEDKVEVSACGDLDDDDDDEMEQEEMFVQAHESFEHKMAEWGGPRRGGRLPEPTRYGDWERKGRCTDF